MDNADNPKPTCVIVAGDPGSFSGMLLAKVGSRLPRGKIVIDDQIYNNPELKTKALNKAFTAKSNIVYLTNKTDGMPIEDMRVGGYDIEVCIAATRPELSFAAAIVNHDRMLGNQPSPMIQYDEYLEHYAYRMEYVYKLEKVLRPNKINVMQRDGHSIYFNELKNRENPDQGWKNPLGAVSAILREGIRGCNDLENRVVGRAYELNNKFLEDLQRKKPTLIENRIIYGHTPTDAGMRTSNEIRSRKNLSEVLDYIKLNTFDYGASTPAHNDDIFVAAQQWAKDITNYSKYIEELTNEKYNSPSHDGGHDPDYLTHLDDVTHKMTHDVVFQAVERRQTVLDAKDHLNRLVQESSSAIRDTVTNNCTPTDRLSYSSSEERERERASIVRPSQLPRSPSRSRDVAR